MEPSRSRALLFAALFTVPTALATPVCPPAGAAIAATAFLCATLTGWPGRRGALLALVALFATWPDGDPAPAWPRPGPVRFNGIVAQCRQATDDRTILLLRGPEGGLQVRCAGPVAARPGDRVVGVGSVEPAIAPDLAPTLHAHGPAIALSPGPWSLAALVHDLRCACERALRAMVPGDDGAVLTLLVLGGAARAPRDVAESHRATGLSHLLAVSGAHAAMLGWLLGLGGAGRGRRLAVGRTHTALALLLLTVYAAITGGEPPVLRAIATYALGAIAVHAGRRLRLWAGLAVPALWTACTEPTAIAGPSFQLSYAAVFGLSLARRDDDSRVGRWLWAPLSASFWATCTTAPISLFWFGQLAPWTIALTPILAPLVGLLLLLGLAAAAFANLAPDLTVVLAAPLRLLLGLYLDAVAAADALPGTPVRAWSAPPAPLVAGAALVAAAALALQTPRRGVLTAVLLLIAPHFLPLWNRAVPGLRLFAVGHGQACLFVDDAGRSVVFDCGSLQHPGLAARKVVDALPHRRVDWLVVTHGDADHHNGIRRLLQAVAVEAALLPSHLRDHPLVALLREHDVAVHLLAAGESLRPTPALTVAAPRVPSGVPGNDQSLWTTIATPHVRVLLTGDAEAFGTTAALAQGIVAPCDVLVLPHHGRWNPLAPRLLAAAHPSGCVASAASADGETAIGTLARSRGAELFVTGLHGDIVLEVGPVPRVRGGVPWRPLSPR